MHEEVVRNILSLTAKLAVDIESVRLESDLYDAGLTSLNTVNVMLAIEDHYDVEFEESMLTRATFQSIGALVDAIEELLD